jgi:cyclic pyranopterin phosphate synthase
MITHSIPLHCQPERIIISPYRSVRIKVTDRCPFTCNFCHHEGSKKSDDLQIGKPFETIIKRFIQELKITEIHLTGGEPTAYAELTNLVKLISSFGLEAKMTSNGQFNNQLLDNLKEEGLKSINISVHTLDPVRLGAIMSPMRDQNWGKKALERQLSNLIYARKIGLKSKINTVVQNNSDITNVITFCKNNNIDLRILDDLNPGSLSIPKIIETLRGIDAIVIGINLTEKASGYSYNIVSADGFEFKVKAIRKNILKSLCNDCRMRDTCKEWFYGIRLEQINNELIVRLCIHRQDYPAKQTIHEFFSSDQFIELLNS